MDIAASSAHPFLTQQTDYRLTAEERADKLRQASEGFEELFLSQLLKAGRAGSLGDDLFGGSAVEKTQEMLDGAFAKAASTSDGLGIADAVYDQFAAHVLARRSGE